MCVVVSVSGPRPHLGYVETAVFASTYTTSSWSSSNENSVLLVYNNNNK